MLLKQPRGRGGCVLCAISGPQKDGGSLPISVKEKAAKSGAELKERRVVTR